MNYTPRFVGTGAVARRYGKCAKTIERWIKNPPEGFPVPAKQNGRYIFDIEALETYERGLAAAAAAGRNEAA